MLYDFEMRNEDVILLSFNLYDHPNLIIINSTHFSILKS